MIRCYIFTSVVELSGSRNKLEFLFLAQRRKAAMQALTLQTIYMGDEPEDVNAFVNEVSSTLLMENLPGFGTARKPVG